VCRDIVISPTSPIVVDNSNHDHIKSLMSQVSQPMERCHSCNHRQQDDLLCALRVRFGPLLTVNLAVYGALCMINNHIKKS
jgi:hypothetical protein